MSKAIDKSKMSEEKKLRLTDKPIPKDLAAKVADRIIRARVSMLFSNPFFGTIAMRMEMYPADAWLPTMAVDGRYLYYNHAFIDSLTQEELVFVFAHEVLHLVYDHLGRKEIRDMQIWNIAADYMVNNDLIKSNVGKMPMHKVKKTDKNGRTSMVDEQVGLYDSKYDGWFSEKVYDDLVKQLEQQQKQSGKSGSGQPGKNGDPQDGSGSGSGGQSLDELLDKMLDEHLSNEGEGDEEGNSGNGNGNQPSESGPAKLSEEDRAQIKADIKDQIVSLSKSCGIGNLPAGVQRIIQDLTAPKMDWKSLLQCSLDSIVPIDYSFLKVSRTGWDLPCVLPGMVNDQLLSIAVAIDMSGSIGLKEAHEFLSEINGIMGQYEQYEIYIFSFDTECYNPKTFSSDNGENINTYVPVGGGGTDGGAIFRFLKQENVVPQRLLVLTDGYVGDFGDPDYTDVLWVIKGSKVEPPFGQFAYMDSD